MVCWSAVVWFSSLLIGSPLYNVLFSISPPAPVGSKHYVVRLIDRSEDKNPLLKLNQRRIRCHRGCLFLQKAWFCIWFSAEQRPCLHAHNTLQMSWVLFLEMTYCAFKWVTSLSLWYPLVVCVCGLSAASALNLEGELFKDLMKGYNKNVRPMEKSGDITQVHIKMTLTNLISLVSQGRCAASDELTLRADTVYWTVSPSEWKGGGPDDERLDRNGNLTRLACWIFFAMIWHIHKNQTLSISVCSNGVTTGSDGTSRPGQLCTGTSPLRCGSPLRASGCRMSYWRTSECNKIQILTQDS